MHTVPSLDPPPEPGRRLVLLVALGAGLASLALYGWVLARPELMMDDFQILVRSWTWGRTWDDLWVPANEHAMPTGRVTTWLLVQAAGAPSRLPWVCVPQGPLAVVAGMGLLYLFVRRELGSPAHALAATALFGVSTVYQQAVLWFSAGFSVLALDTFLLALLAAQRWRRGGGVVSAALCVLAAALAPTWFASGVLAGPLCGLYLLLPESDLPRRSSWPRGLARATLPLLGTLLFLAVSLPRTAQHILHLEHYGDGDALHAFKPLTGLWYSLRSVIENLLLGQVGVGSVDVPAFLVIAAWPLLIAGLVTLRRRAPSGRRLILLGLGTIFAGYGLVYSARADWGYDGVMNRPNWSRYHLLPQLGLALIAAGGLTGRLPAEEGLSRRRARALLLLIALLFVTQLPRILLTSWGDGYDEQAAALRRVEEVDALCRRYRIDAATARRALPFFEIPGSYARENGWEFLRGSADPDPSVTPEEARRLLSGDE